MKRALSSMAKSVLARAWRSWICRHRRIAAMISRTDSLRGLLLRRQRLSFRAVLRAALARWRSRVAAAQCRQHQMLRVTLRLSQRRLSVAVSTWKVNVLLSSALVFGANRCDLICWVRAAIFKYMQTCSWSTLCDEL